MHNMPGLTQGHLALRDGPAMASSDDATVMLSGVGGHGALPHHATDPVVAAAGIIMALQTVVSRNIDPLQAAVVAVGAVHAGQANNVIPAKARLELSVRALDRRVRSQLEQRVKALVMSQAESFGVATAIEWRRGYSVLVNTAAETEFAREVALQLLGPERVMLQAPPVTASEDFAFMLERVPGCYLMIGNGNGNGNGSGSGSGSGNGDGSDGQPGGACRAHTPGYDFNDANIAVGAAYWTLLVERFLKDDTDLRPRGPTAFEVSF